MKKLLVPIDGSENAGRAARYAAELAKQTGASVHLLHVCEEYADAERAHAYYSQAELRQPCKELGEADLKAAEALISKDGVGVTSEIVFGDYAHTIVKRADELGCDGIVMGTRGLGGIAELFMGTTATKVLALTKLPVTLVK